MTMSHPNRHHSALIERPQEVQFQPVHVMQDGPERILSFGHYFWLLRRCWWKVLAAVAVCTGLAAFASFHLTPIYESTARIAIDLKTSSTVIGEPTVDGTNASDADQLFNTELQVIQSDGVLRPVADQFHLISTRGPRKMPVGVKVADTPVSFSGLGVTHPANSYLIDISYRSQDPIKAAAVANAIAHSYIRRNMEMRVHASMEQSTFMEAQIGELKKNMDDSAEKLAEYEKQLGVINADEKTSILTARLLQLNSQYTDAQNDRIRKEADYQASQTGSLAAVEVSPQAAALVKMEDAVHAAQEKMATAKTVYGPNYAEYKRAANDLNEVTRQYNTMQAEIGKRIQVEYNEATDRESMLRASLLQTKSEADALDARSMEYQELKSQAEANESLYNELFRKVQEAGINGAFQGSAMRIEDEARPQLWPVFPKHLLFIELAFLFSLVSSMIVAIVADMGDKSLRDPEQAQLAVGANVLGILPHVRQFKTECSMLQAGSNSSSPSCKNTSAWFSTSDFYGEAINTLLSSILNGRRTQALRSILITSAVSDEGKSVCVAHMAAAYARQGYSTLLIDTDLRNPSQQQLFVLGKHVGLADAIIDNVPLADICQRVENNEMLHVITTGTPGKPGYDRIGKKMQEILVEASREYDMVFIDAPPMLYFAEPLDLASIVDGVLVISRAGQTSREAVSVVLAKLRRLGANTLGVVLNHVKYNMSSSYQPYQSYYRTLSRTALKQA